MDRHSCARGSAVTEARAGTDAVAKVRAPKAGQNKSSIFRQDIAVILSLDQNCTDFPTQLIQLALDKFATQRHGPITDYR
jgi:hypothetical protein